MRERVLTIDCAASKDVKKIYGEKRWDKAQRWGSDYRLEGGSCVVGES